MESFKNYLSDHKIFQAINEGWEEDVRYFVMNDGKGRYKILDHWNTLMKKFPFTGGTLYRGLNFDSPQEYLAFRRATKDGYITTQNLSSWSRDYKTAETFAKNKQTYGLDYAVAKAYDEFQKKQERIMGWIGVVLEIKLPANVGFDVSASGQGSEDEVLVPSGKYRLVNVHAEKRFQHLMKRADYNQIMVDWIKSDNQQTPEVKWILRNQPGMIMPQTIEMMKDMAAKQIAKSIKVTSWHDPNSTGPFSFNGTSKLFPGGKFTVNLNVDGTLFGPLEELGQTVVINDRSIATKVEKQLNAALAGFDPSMKLTVYNESMMKYTLNLLGVRYTSVKKLRTYFSEMYKRHDEVLRGFYKSGEHHSRDAKKVTEDMTDVLKLVSVFG